MNEKKYSQISIAKIFSDLINLFALGLLVIVVILYWQNDSKLIAMHQFAMPITDWVISPIFFVKWIVKASNYPEFTQAFIVMVYLVFILIFLNVYLSTRLPFSGNPKKYYYISFQGFFDFLEDHIYCKQSILISLGSIKNFNQKNLNNGDYIKAATYKELITKYFNKIGIQYFGFYVISGLMFFPWAAYDKVNNSQLTILPFWFAVIAFAYIQIRFLFELLILLPIFTSKTYIEEK